MFVNISLHFGGCFTLQLPAFGFYFFLWNSLPFPPQLSRKNNLPCHSRGCKWGREFGFHWGKKWAWICSHIDDHTASTVEDVTLDCLEYGTEAVKYNEAKEDGYVDARASRVEGFLMNGSSAGNGRSYGCWESALVMHTLFQKVVIHWKLYRCCWFSKPANWKSGFIRFSHAIKIVYNSLWKPAFSSFKK